MWKFGKRRPVLFFASPVFGAADRVDDPPDNGGGLPAELVGKSPAEIARYYSQREAALRAELTPRPSADPPAPAAAPVPSAADWYNNPADASKRMIQATALSREEFERTAASLRPSLIWVAREQCLRNHPSDFSRVETEINEVMNKVPEWQRTDPNMWETAYTFAKGKAHDRLSTEDRLRPPSAEPVNPGGPMPAPIDADLSKITLPGLKPNQTAAHVADAMGISHDSYRKASKELDGEGKLPLTYDNRRAR